jgi:hypothetical protein
VFQSRARQAVRGSLAQPFTEGAAGPTNCGLGRDAAVELGLSDRAAVLFRELWPEGCDGEALRRIDAVVAEWCRRQDQLDRDRNHFLKAFRQEHGFDRTRYTAEETAAYGAGLERINTQVEVERADHARRLLG